MANLKEGRANALQSSQLSKKVGLDARAIRRAMEIIRRSGVVVCACHSGYYFPDDIDELQQYITQEAKRINNARLRLQTAYYLLQDLKKGRKKLK